MSTERFEFQREQARRALRELPGLILNVGANDDPAELKRLDPKRVVNTDLFAHDQVLDRPNAADVLFDCARERWPFDDDCAALVILGDILEHLDETDMLATLQEARRVGFRLCVTVPQDEREQNNPDVADGFPRGAVHRTVVTADLLRRLLAEAGWEPAGWQEVEYDDGSMWGQRTMGHFVSAQHA